MAVSYQTWLNDVRSALESINMPMDEWQRTWQFDFVGEFKAGTGPGKAAEKANRFWWHEQNKSIGQACGKDPKCWLPQGHQGECQPAVQESRP